MVQENDDVRIANLISAETRGRDRSTPDGFACPREIHIMPFMYGVVSSKDTDLLNRFAPEFPAHLKLGRQLTEVSAPDAHTRYAVRMMRTGHIYVFAKRNTVQGNNLNECWGLDGHFECDKNHNLRFIDEAGHQPRVRYSPTYSSYFSIHNPMDVHELRILFTPVALTADMIQAVLEDEELRNKIQQFDINTLLNNVVFQDTPPEDTLRMQDVTEVVTEIRAHKFVKDNPSQRQTYEDYIHILRDQFFPHMLVHQHSTQYHHLNAEVDKLFSIPESLARSVQRDSKLNYAAGVVLEDAIGITQALNNWRNDALETDFYANYLNRRVEDSERDKSGKVTHERLVRSAYAFDMLKQNYGLLKVCAEVKPQWKNYQQSTEAINENMLRTYRDRYEYFKSQAEYHRGRAATDGGSARAYERMREGMEETKQQISAMIAQVNTNFVFLEKALEEAKRKQPEYQVDFDNRLSPLFNHNRAQSVKERYQQEWDAAMAIAKDRIEAHIAWLRSEELVDALEFYDRQDPLNGADFAAAVGFCVIGADQFDDAYKDLFDNWWEPEGTLFADERRNLALRAFCFNNSAAFQAIREIAEATTELDTALTRDRINNFDDLNEEQKQQIPAYVTYSVKLRGAASAFNALLNLNKEHGLSLASQLELGRPSPTRFAGSLIWVQQLQTRLLNVGGSTQLDYRLFSFFRNIAVVQLGEEIKAAEMAGQFVKNDNRRISRVVISNRLTKLWSQSFNGRVTFAQIRMSSLMIVANCVALIAQIFKVGTQGLTREDALKIYGLSFSTIGTLFSYMATAIEASLASYSLEKLSPDAKPGRPASRISYDATKVSGYRFKLIGAGLAAMGMVPVCLYEAKKAIPDLVNTWEEENWFLRIGYGCQVAMNVGVAGILLFSAQSALKSMMAAVAQQAENSLARLGISAQSAALQSAARAGLGNSVLSRIVASRVGAAALTGLSNPFTLVGAVVLILTTGFFWALGYYDNNRDYEPDMWLKRCTLGPESGEGVLSPYDSLDKELQRYRQMLATVSDKVPLEIFFESFIDEETLYLDELGRI